MAELVGKALVAQGGGPTAVINQTLAGIILGSKEYSHISRLYGAERGVRGIIEENFLDLSSVSFENIQKVARTPGAALKSTRDKPDSDYCLKIFDKFKKHDIRYFFYIGGNDSADTCRIINEHAKDNNYDLRVFHVPKTIDNDLLVNDHTPGYGSAAKFVAQAFAGIDRDNYSLEGVYIGIVMGRHAGFLTAASALAKKSEFDAPHLVFIPEYPFHTDKFLGKVEKVFSKYGRCVVAVSEGITDATGEPIINTLSKGEREVDSHGNVQLSGTGALGDMLSNIVRTELKIKRVRSDTFGYLQRSFLGCVSESDSTEARECGEMAVVYSSVTESDGSVTIRRKGEYEVEYDLTPLNEVAGKTKLMPKEFYDADQNNVTKSFMLYAKPLVGAFPDSVKLSARKIEI
ncbi:6-phosphofructokinase [candidate division WOR-3 bacterium]|nr:6-phosphofructokinase [candidate division WOR-3 bacterium]